MKVVIEETGSIINEEGRSIMDVEQIRECVEMRGANGGRWEDVNLVAGTKHTCCI